MSFCQSFGWLSKNHFTKCHFSKCHDKMSLNQISFGQMIFKHFNNHSSLESHFQPLNGTINDFVKVQSKRHFPDWTRPKLKVGMNSFQIRRSSRSPSGRSSTPPTSRRGTTSTSSARLCTNVIKHFTAVS
jgi:hypothetical protein